MLFQRWSITFVISMFGTGRGLGPTDTIRDADNWQSGYLAGHNIHPDNVTSEKFGLLWSVTTGGNIPGSPVTEQFLAKPLVYTVGQTQMVIAFSETNWVYVLDATTGAILKKRQVRRPFMEADLPCAELPGNVGGTGTPIIDPTTDTLFFFAKGYRTDGGPGGVTNGAYFFYAINVLSLVDRPGYPVLIDGNHADNALDRYFHGGTHLQRASLSMHGNTVYGGFAGVCEQYNFTGWVVGVDTATAKIKTIFSTISGPRAPPQNGTWQGGGGGAGIWQCGRSFASDRPDRFFLATSNGQLLGNYGHPIPGKTPTQLLEGSVVNFKVEPATGRIAAQDFFQPYDYADTAPIQRDLGSGGVTILDPQSFATPKRQKLGLAGGKAGKLYLLDLDNLGGFKNGIGQKDAVLQTITMPPTGPPPNPPLGAIFGAIAALPLGAAAGGYLYVKPTSQVGSTPLSKIYVYKFDTITGIFSEVAQSDDTTPSYVGTGAPTISSYDNNPATAVLWVTERNGGLHAYRAVPVGGKLQKIKTLGGVSSAKFQRAVFGDGRVYLGTSNGTITCFGIKQSGN